MSDEIRDELPDDLNPAGFVGAYMFPDNSRRRWPGAIYLVLAALCLVVRFAFADAAVVRLPLRQEGDRVSDCTAGVFVGIDDQQGLQCE